MGRVGVRNPVFLLDEIDRLDDAFGSASVLLEALDPAPGTTFRYRYLDLPFDLSGAFFVATATRIRSVPPMLRERMREIVLPGYTEMEKRVITTGQLLPLQLALHGLTADQVHVTDETVEAVIRSYTRECGTGGGARRVVRQGGAPPSRGARSRRTRRERKKNTESTKSTKETKRRSR